ncbi:hypothetical protein ACHHYP_08735 [Achlya hypogyna]|uniref:Uncharacterized protein n=1 Tax=Achlya hypogyna TaxID=1202772 RepID=A0A1V9ZK15_ACHHY|nr:hypothetical protein ACHHYP_08735 [Achlya hypogyna]
MDEVVAILQRELDEFMATHAASEFGIPATEKRMSSIWTRLASRNFVAAVDTLLQWQATKVSNSVFARTGLCLVGQILCDVLRSYTPGSMTHEKQDRLDATFDRLVLVALKVLEDGAVVAPKPTDLFSTFRPSVPVKGGHGDAVMGLWKDVLGLLGKHAIRSIHSALQDEHVPKEIFLQWFARLRLHLLHPYDARCTCDSIGCLRTVLLYVVKPHKLNVRVAALGVVADVLSRTLDGLSADGLAVYHSSKHVEWTSYVSDAHAIVFRICAKKKRLVVLAVAWEVRIAVLMLANGEIFSRYWRDDALALLRLHAQHKDPASLRLVSRFFALLIRRHMAAKRRFPLEKDMMEVINLVQAWCFPISRHKPAKLDALINALVDITLTLGRYNMQYCLQNHVRRLILEATSVFDERRLVGLQALRAIFELTPVADIDKDWDEATIAVCRPVLADIVGNILIECNTYFGSATVLPASMKVSAYKQWVGLRAFEATIACIRWLYAEVGLNDDQKTMILTRCAVHAHVSLRVAATDTLQAVARTHLSPVCRGVVDYIMRMPTSEKVPTSLPTLLQLLKTVLTAADVAMDDSSMLQQVEALCLYLLCGVAMEARTNALELLSAVANLRRRAVCGGIGINVVDIVTGIDSDLALVTGLTLDEKRAALAAGGVLRWLAQLQTQAQAQRLFAQVQPEVDDDDDTRDARISGLDWLWSQCLATLFCRVCDVCPDLVGLVWADVDEASCRLEPLIPPGADSAAELSHAQWRNCAIFACATASVARGDSTRSLVSMLLRRLARYLKSPSTSQRSAAVLALGATHASAHHLLLDALVSYEGEAFGGVDDRLPASPTKLPKRTSKHQLVVARSLELQTGLQWALARIYRLLLEHPERRQHVWHTASFRRQILRFVDRLQAELPREPASAPTPCLLKRDICAIVESIVHQNNIAFGLPAEDADGDDDPTLQITPRRRAEWFQTLRCWCGELSDWDALETEPVAWSHLLPMENGSMWHPLHHASAMADGLCVRFELVSGAVGAMATLLIGPAFDVDGIFGWLDNVFGASPAISSWKASARRGCRHLLASDDPCAISFCVDRCLRLPVDGPPACTAQYLSVVADVAYDLCAELEASSSFPKLLLAGLVHIETADALHVLKTLLDDDNTPRDATAPVADANELRGIAAKVADKYAAQAVNVLEAIFSFTLKCPNAMLQTRLLERSIPWIHALATPTPACLTALFRLTAALQVPTVGALWVELARGDTGLAAVVTFFYSLEELHKLATAKWILTCLAQAPGGSDRVVQHLMTHDSVQRQHLDIVLDVASRTVLFIAPVVAHAGPGPLLPRKWTIFSSVASVLHAWVGSHELGAVLVWSVPADLMRRVLSDGVALLLALTPKSTVGHAPLAASLQALSAVAGAPTLVDLRHAMEALVLSLTEPDRVDWAAACIDEFANTSRSPQAQLLAQSSLELYRALAPPFDGGVCVRLMGLLRAALEDVDSAGFVPEYLMTLTLLATRMPPAKLALFPQLVWVAVALLTHCQGPLAAEPLSEALQGPSLRLLRALVAQPTFRQPVVQDMLAARRPPTWAPRDVTLDMLVAISRHETSPEAAALVCGIARTLLFTARSKAHCLACTALLLPTMIAAKDANDARDLSYLWRLQGHEALANALPTLDAEVIGPLLLECVALPEDEKLVLDTFLAILLGSCTELAAPTLAILSGLVGEASPALWKRNPTLLACLTRRLRATPAADETWPALVALVGSLLPAF